VLANTNLGARFIVLFGPDGAGKSTQARLLTSFLRTRGIRVRNVWIRNFHFPLAFILSKFFVRMGYFGVEPNPKRGKADPDDPWGRAFSIGALPPMKRLWGFIEFISVVPHLLLRCALPRALGYTVIAERYTIDTVVTVAYVLQDCSFMDSFTARVLFSLIPKKAIRIYLSASYEEILARREENAHGRRFIEFHISAYDQLSTRLGAHRIPTDMFSIGETFRVIERLLSEG